MKDSVASSLWLVADISGGAPVIFACNGATPPVWGTLFPTGNHGPRMVFGATRACPSNPMTDALECVVKAIVEGKLDTIRARSITQDIKGCVWNGKEWIEPKTRFLSVLP